jgi:tRNA pseudouridine38-40 synthase
MRNLSLVVAYDGSRYHGWQCQPKVVTVEQTLREGVERIVNHPVKLYAAGRTDTGVHAMGQVVNFGTEREIPCENLMRGLNSLLPDDIRVRRAGEVAASFHARYSATSKTYLYCILNREYGSPFYFRYAWHVPFALDVHSMQGAVSLLKGCCDFASFKKKNEPYKDTVREVIAAHVRKRGDLILLNVEATGFLRYMMRNIAGTLVDVGSGRTTVQGFGEILEAGDRDRAGPTAPAKGLFLKEIRYPDSGEEGAALTGARQGRGRLP